MVVYIKREEEEYRDRMVVCIEREEKEEKRERRFVCIEREKEEKMTASAKDEEKLKTVKLDGRLSNQINSEQAPYE